jgi:hypothetical protein
MMLKLYLFAAKFMALLFLSSLVAAYFATAPTIVPSGSLTEVPVPVSFHLPIALIAAWIGSIAIGLTGIAVIWKFIVKASALINEINLYGSVLVDIAKEFKSDSGSTLRDSINRLERGAMEMKAASELNQQTVESMKRSIDAKRDY